MDLLYRVGRWVLGLVAVLKSLAEGSVVVRVPIDREAPVSVSVEVRHGNGKGFKQSDQWRQEMAAGI
jgi:hypothetical protein